MRFLFISLFALHATCFPIVAAEDSITAQRQADMTAERERLQKRLKQVISKAQREHLVAGLNKLGKYGITGKGYLLCRPSVHVPIIRNDAPIVDATISSITTFSKQMAENGIHLIVAPVPMQMEVTAHRFSTEVHPEHVVCGARVEAMLKLLANGVEVLDMTAAFQKQDGERFARGLPPSLYHVADHHWRSDGMSLLAESVSRRLKRYPDIMDSGYDRTAIYKKTEKSVRSPRSLLGFNRLKKSKDLSQLLVKAKLPENENLTFISYLPETKRGEFGGVRGRGLEKDKKEKKISDGLALPDDLMIIGDSQVFFHTGNPSGSGFPNHLGYHIGRPVFYWGRVGFNKNWGVYWSHYLYRKEVLPKVVVFTFMMTSLVNSVTEEQAWPAIPAYSKEKANDKEKAAGIAGYTGKAKLKLTKVYAKKPDPQADPYPNAFYLVEGTLMDGPHKGKTIAIVHWAMKDRKLVDAAMDWSVGQVLTLQLTPWDQVVVNNKRFKEIQQLDAGVDILAPFFWAERK